MPHMLGAFALVMDFLTAVRAQMLLAVFTEDGLHLVGSLLALLTDELDLVLVSRVTSVALGTADLFALQAPQCAFGLLIAFLALDCHQGRYSRLRCTIIIFMDLNYEYLQTLRTDFTNLTYCWLYSVLYFQQLYPKSAFEFRTSYGVATPVAISPKLRAYVDEFFKQIDHNFMCLNYIQVQIAINNNPAHSHRFAFGFGNEQSFSTRHQKQIEFKYFLTKMLQGFKHNPLVSSNKKTFRMFVQYRSDHQSGDKIKAGKYIDRWILSPGEDRGSIGQKLVGSSLKLADFNVICSRNDLH